MVGVEPRSTCPGSCGHGSASFRGTLFGAARRHYDAGRDRRRPVTDCNPCTGKPCQPCGERDHAASHGAGCPCSVWWLRFREVCVSRRLASLTLDNLDDLPRRCRACVFWELDPIARRSAEGSGDPGMEKEAWVSATLLEWGSCGKIVYVDSLA